MNIETEKWGTVEIMVGGWKSTNDGAFDSSTPRVIAITRSLTVIQFPQYAENGIGRLIIAGYRPISYTEEEWDIQHAVLCALELDEE